MKENYFDRNRGWLFPIAAGLMIAAGQIMLEMMEIKTPLPSWVPYTAAAIGFFISGIKAAFINTLSATILKIFAQAFAVGMVLYGIYIAFS